MGQIRPGKSPRRCCWGPWNAFDWRGRASRRNSIESTPMFSKNSTITSRPHGRLYRSTKPTGVHLHGHRWWTETERNCKDGVRLDMGSVLDSRSIVQAENASHYKRLIYRISQLTVWLIVTLTDELIDLWKMKMNKIMWMYSETGDRGLWRSSGW